MIILDTNVISEPMHLRPNNAVVAWLDAQPVETLYLTAISLAEVRFGLARLPDGRRKHRLGKRFEEDVLPAFADRVLPFDTAASASYALLRAEARRRGAAINELDALIAGIAGSRGFAVATRDTSQFTAASIRVINPFDG